MSDSDKRFAGLVALILVNVIIGLVDRYNLGQKVADLENRIMKLLQGQSGEAPPLSPPPPAENVNKAP